MMRTDAKIIEAAIRAEDDVARARLLRSIADVREQLTTANFDVTTTCEALDAITELEKILVIAIKDPNTPIQTELRLDS